MKPRKYTVALIDLNGKRNIRQSNSSKRNSPVILQNKIHEILRLLFHHHIID